MSTREVFIASVTLIGLVALVWIAGIERWLLTGLWSFMAVWSLRTGLGLYRSTGRRALLISGVAFAIGAACGACMYGLWEQPSVAMPLAVSFAAFMGVALVLATIQWRRHAR